MCNTFQMEYAANSNFLYLKKKCLFIKKKEENINPENENNNTVLQFTTAASS